MRNTAFHFDYIEQTIESGVAEVPNAIQNPWLPVLAVAVFGLSVLTYSIGTSNLGQKDTLAESTATVHTGSLKMGDINKLFGTTPPQSTKFYEEMTQPSEPSAPSVLLDRKVANESQ